MTTRLPEVHPPRSPASQCPSRSERISLQIYRFLLLFYPVAFRLEYGEPMLQLFRDSCRAARRKSGPAGVLVLWARTLADVLLSLVEQYSQRGAFMTRTQWIKLSGWLMTASGLLLLLGWFAQSRPEYNEYNAAAWPVDRFFNAAGLPLIILGLLTFIAGISGLRARFDSPSGALGRTGLLLAQLGAAVALVGAAGLGFNDSGPWWDFTVFGFTTIPTGLGLFGIATLNRQLLPRWNSLIFLAGFAWPVLIAVEIMTDLLPGVAYQTPEVIVLGMFILAFGGITAAGYTLQATTNTAA